MKLPTFKEVRKRNKKDRTYIEDPNTIKAHFWHGLLGVSLIGLIIGIPVGVWISYSEAPELLGLGVIIAGVGFIVRSFRDARV